MSEFLGIHAIEERAFAMLADHHAIALLGERRDERVGVCGHDELRVCADLYEYVGEDRDGVRVQSEFWLVDADEPGSTGPKQQEQQRDEAERAVRHTCCRRWGTDVLLVHVQEDRGAAKPRGEAVEARETSERVEQALGKLSVEYREVVVLRYFGELSYEEISEALGVPEKTVKSRLFSARQRLATELGE